MSVEIGLPIKFKIPIGPPLNIRVILLDGEGTILIRLFPDVTNSES